MLSVIPVPIGNREDITLRALKLLQELSVIFCEDTRSTIKLLRLYNIDWRNKKLLSLTSFTGDAKKLSYLDLIKEQHCGLVSDAGTPGLSDPGKELIKYCWEYHINFDVLPGPNALIPAVVASGFDTSSFVYIGFLPTKKGRQTKLLRIINSELPVFVYESVHRVEKTLTQLEELGFTGKVLLARELSKMHEQIVCDNITVILKGVQDGSIPLKGEFVLGFSSDS